MPEYKPSDEKSIIQTHFPLPSTYYPHKRWITAMSSSAHRQKKMHNECIEAAYHKVIKVLKEQLTPNEVYYEHDMKTDNVAGFLSMHCFITSTFYWRLDCSFLYHYEVTYVFTNMFPNTEVLHNLMNSYPLDRCKTLKELKQPFGMFFNNVINCQDSKHIHIHL